MVYMRVMAYWREVSCTPWRGFEEGSNGLGGEGCRCPYDGNGLVYDGAAKGLAVGGGIGFFVGGRVQVG
jgi:hypothetical protein